MRDFSYILGQDPSYIESLYQDYSKEAASVDPEWKKFFEGFDFAMHMAPTNGKATTTAPAQVSGDVLVKELAVFELIRAYRKRGHLAATTNPIRTRKNRHPQLDLNLFKLDESDLDKSFDSGRFIGMKGAKLRDIHWCAHPCRWKSGSGYWKS